METNLKKNTIDLGIKLGTFLFVITALIYVIDLKLFTNTWIMLAYMLPTLAVSIYSVYSAKKIQNQIITFKEAFTAYFLCVAIGYLIIDTAAADLIHEEIMVFTKTMMENFNSPSEVIALTMDEMQKNHSFSWMAIVQNYANALLRNAIFGLIIALIFKKS